MVTNFSSLEEYTAYIDGCSLEDLKSIASLIDREKYPERCKLVLNRLEAMVTEQELSETAHEPKVISIWFKTSDIMPELRVPWSYIFFALNWS